MQDNLRREDKPPTEPIGPHKKDKRLNNQHATSKKLTHRLIFPSQIVSHPPF